MIKNTKLKKLLVNNVFPVFSFMNKIIGKDDRTIFIYCANDDLSDNSLELFDYLVRNDYNQKYKIICGVGDPADYSDKVSLNVSFIPKKKCVLQYMRSGHVFYSMGKMPIKPAKDQCVINLWHGIPLKKIGKMLPVDSGNEFFFSFVCASSELYRPIMAKAFGCPESNVCICGEQKQDRLFEKKEARDYKYIVWTPTFRQSNYLGYDDSTDSSLLPPLKNNEWDELNEVLKERNVKILVKLHPLQDLSGFEFDEKSNLKVMSDKHFKASGKNLYSELAQSDALIADYSSVYLEYLVINRPICFVVSDMEEYNQNRGFVFENPFEYMPGPHIRDKYQLFKFIEQIQKDEDPYRDEREIIMNKVHCYKDNKNCQRILEKSGITK